ncbi:Ferrous-iron efflux pump FieF [Vibrio stylophorae]|uniref:Ferrous-iron efflux pump FieF n=1 Tax=Vibrio stylophorae TaxID=659351 RepID=A0ABM8ZW58_9VIBR|nr:CDF family cation-efflux transporter FieF [Vibrio stylophorae]CAH0534577.1 Ferrous-iron efflux pump FieF [Vibrio stylophorae]
MSSRYQQLVQWAALAATIVASLLLTSKLVVWWYTESVSMLASLVDSALDLLASLTNMLVVRYALQPADEEHRFGHGKAESLAALAQAAFISGSACFLVLNGVERFFRPQDIQSPELGVGISFVAILVTLALLSFQRYVVRQTQSQAIAADALHYQSDLLMNGAILVALALSWWGWWWADPVFAVLIGVYILVSAGKMAQQAVQSLLDRQLPEDECKLIYQRALAVPQVCGAHQLRTRQAGEIRFIQLHIELDDELSLIDAHTVADQVEDAILEQFPAADVLIHLDPLSVLHNEREQKFDFSADDKLT